MTLAGNAISSKVSVRWVGPRNLSVWVVFDLLADQLNIPSGEDADGRLDCYRHAQTFANHCFSINRPATRGVGAGLCSDFGDDAADRGCYRHQGKEDDGLGLGNDVRAGFMAVHVTIGSSNVSGGLPVPHFALSQSRRFWSTRS